MKSSIAAILIFLLASGPLAAQEAPLSQPAGRSAAQGKSYAPYPQPQNGYITDMAGILTPDQKRTLNNYCYTTEKKTNVEVAVVIINSISDYPGTDNSSIESFATGLFNTYGIGNLPKNDGVLLLVALRDRRVRIELGKYYGHSRDGDAQRIIDKEILPNFRKGDYPKGITAGTTAILQEFAGVRIRFPWHLVIMGLVVVALVPVCVSLFRNGKRGWGWVVAGIIIILIVFIIKGAFKVVENMPSGSGAGGFGGGFGGGSSGGGGASGSW